MIKHLIEFCQKQRQFVVAVAGIYFTATVCVGTPPQCFDAVADTGSDNVIITSCICNDLMGTGCQSNDKCFRGTGNSKTFSVAKDPVVEFITFGSGTLETAIATDMVEVGNRKANMSEGLLLIINRADLEISGDFQGILGLGVPKGHWPATSSDTVMEQTYNNESLVFASATFGPSQACMLFPKACNSRSSFEHSSRKAELPSKLFLETAQVDRFSVCFQDSKPGALRFQVPFFSDPIPQIGQAHWGLSFVGLSIGPRHQPAPSHFILCDPHDMTQGMKNPCGIIPDSGTTLITGPAHQVQKLQANLCKEWPRCNQQANGQPSAALFQDLLLNCSSWLSDEGLAEIPSIFFHVGIHGAAKAFELTSWAWVTQSISQDQSQSACFSGFGEMDYITNDNGPVWIFGTPLFYEYIVGFDTATREVALDRAACAPCTESTTLMTMESGKRPRIHRGQHVRQVDVSLPL